MSTLIIPWDSHHQLVISEPGPWVAKKVSSGTFAYCPVCHAFPQTKLGHEECRAIACPCHNTTAKIEPTEGEEA